jgi:hypothetical protein
MDRFQATQPHAVTDRQVPRLEIQSVSNWKGAEREIAKILTKQLSDIGMDFLIKRIPILGRTGPDLTFPNPMHLVIDVKSRLEVPVGLFKCIVPGQWRWIDAREHRLSGPFPLYWICQLKDFKRAMKGTLPNPNTIDQTAYSVQWRSVVVERWLRHISKWARLHLDERGRQEQFGALILRRPRMPYGKSVVLIDGYQMSLRGVWHFWREEGLTEVKNA